jgi:hypothetical protein
MSMVLASTSSSVLVVRVMFRFKAADPALSLCRAFWPLENTIGFLGGITWIELIVTGCSWLAEGNVTGRVFVDG